MARPSPEPPGRDELEKGVNNCARTLGGTPGPVSAISRYILYLNHLLYKVDVALIFPENSFKH